MGCGCHRLSCRAIRLFHLSCCASQVVAAAYPWIAKRLLTDSQEDMRQLLRSLLYDRDQGFNFKRLQSLLVNAG